MIRKENGQGTVELPCREGSKHPLGANYDATPIRSQKVRTRQSAKEDLLEQYSAVIQQCTELGHAEMFSKNAHIGRDTHCVPQRENMRGELLTAKFQAPLHALSPKQDQFFNECVDIRSNHQPEKSTMSSSTFSPFATPPQGVCESRRLVHSVTTDPS